MPAFNNWQKFDIIVDAMKVKLCFRFVVLCLITLEVQLLYNILIAEYMCVHIIL